MLFMGLLVLSLFSCTDSIKYSRTVGGEFTMPFTVDNTGTFTKFGSISSYQILEAFGDDVNPLIADVTIDAINVRSGKVKLNVANDNTASSVNLSVSLKNGSKVLVNARDYYLPVDTYITQYIVNEALDKAGVQTLNKDLTDNMKQLNAYGVDFTLEGVVPEGKQLKGTVTIVVNVSLSYTVCETLPYGMGDTQCEDK